MEKLFLTRPAEAYLAQIAAYRREFLDAGDSMDGSGALARMPDPAEWLAHTRMLETAAEIPDNWVRATQFLALRACDGRLVGMLQVRHAFNEFLETYGGNIGYSVRPDARGRGYATQMLAQALPFCREIGLRRVLVTCLEENAASRRVIGKNGGVYESTVTEPRENVRLERYWIAL